jgi:soluble lytic murein transglycosylase-like protein
VKNIVIALQAAALIYATSLALVFHSSGTELEEQLRVLRAEHERQERMSARSQRDHESRVAELISRIAQYEKERRLAQEEAVERRFNSTATKIRHLQPRISDDLLAEVTEVILEKSDKWDLPEDLILAVISKESSFRPHVISHANCIGLMQINPRAHPEKLKQRDLCAQRAFKVRHNIDIGCQILREYLDRTGDIRAALYRYVGGREDTYVYNVLRTYADLTLMG